MGLAAIAAMLNERGVPPATSERRRGVRAWTKGTLWAILRNSDLHRQLIYGKRDTARSAEAGEGPPARRRPDRRGASGAGDRPAALWEAAQAKHGTGVRRRAPVAPSIPADRADLCGHCGKRFRAHKQSHGSVSAYYVAAATSLPARACATVPHLPALSRRGRRGWHPGAAQAGAGRRSSAKYAPGATGESAAAGGGPHGAAGGAARRNPPADQQARGCVGGRGGSIERERTAR